MTRFLRTHWRQIGMLAMSVVVFAQLVQRGRDLHMDRDHFSFRLFGQAQVMAALGRFVPGQPDDYSVDQRLTDVAQRYWNRETAAPFGEVIAEATRATATGTRDRGWVIDDKGYVDLLTLAIATFGFHRSSLFYAWFLALAVPMVVYAAYAARTPMRLALLPMILLAVYVTAPVTLIDDQLASLHDSRFFSVVGIVPLLSILFVMADGAPPTAATVAVVGAQAAMLAFVYHCRSESMWQPLCAAAALPMFVWWNGLDRRPRWKRFLTLSWPLLVVLVAFGGLRIYKRAYYHPYYYGQGYSSHLFWHTLIIGLSAEPSLAREYGLDELSDMSVIDLVRRRLKTEGRDESLAMMWFNTDGGKYEAAVRDIMLDIVAKHPGRAIRSVVYDKPVALIDEFAHVMGFRSYPPTMGGHRFASEDTRRAERLYYQPLNLFALVVTATLTLLVPWRPLAAWRTIGLTVGVVWLFSLVSPLLTITMTYLLGSVYVTTALALYAAIVAAGSALLGAVARTTSPDHADAIAAPLTARGTRP